MSSFRDQLCDLVKREAQPSHKFGHQVRLYSLSRNIGKGLDYDDDIVFAAIWLHDLGVFNGNRPAEPSELATWDHVAYAVRRSHDLLPALGLSPETVERVVEAIREHQPQDTPASNEAIIVRDADILEQLGAVAVFRTAAKLGSDTRFASFEDVAQHLEGRLRVLPDQLVLATSRALAATRIRSLRDFLAAYKDELAG